MNARLSEMMQSWHPGPGTDPCAQIPALLESSQAAGLLRASTTAVLLGEQYHLGGAEDTRRMAELVRVIAADRVLDLACYVGGPARQLARECGCQVVGVDISDMDLKYGWYPAKEKLRANDARYCTLMGEAWVRQTYAELDIDVESWRSGRAGNGRIVAVKPWPEMG